jgi:GDSL-like Lipase/Acylhydrolase family
MTTSNERRSFRPGVVFAGSFFFLVMACLIVFVGAEAGGRAYLAYRNPAYFWQPPESPWFGFVNSSPWTYDQEAGYRYKPNHVWIDGRVRGGRLHSCVGRNKTDALGNMGSSAAGYQDAELKVLVLGDSITAQAVDSVTYPALLERELSQRLGRRVAAMNLGRDGYGVLQMVDLAVREVPRWKPDLVLINFITDDLDRARFWRTEMVVDGRPHVFTTPIANPNPLPSSRVDTTLLAPEASQEWCDRLIAQKDQRGDRILQQLTTDFVKESETISVRPALWDLDYSVVAETIRHGDPFAFVSQRSVPSHNPRIRRDRYDDAQLVAGLSALQGYGVPVYYVHLPIHPEIKGGNYRVAMYKAALLSDLERLLGGPVLRSLPYVLAVPADFDRMPIEPDDWHPSPFGMQIYATALADMLERIGALDPWARRAATKP